MNTGAISSSSVDQGMHSYIQERDLDLRQLGKALKSGDLAQAQAEFKAIATLGQNGPFANGNSFQIAQRQQDFEKIGQALEAGDLAGAQKAFAKLGHSVQQMHREPPPAAFVNLSGLAPQAADSSQNAAPGGPEIVLNLGNMPAGEKISIGIKDAGNGAERVAIRVSDQQGNAAEQIVLNLQQSSNQRIILNLFNGNATAPAQSSVSETA